MITLLDIIYHSYQNPSPFFGGMNVQQCHWTAGKCDLYCVHLLHVYVRHNQTVLDKQEAFIFF